MKKMRLSNRQITTERDAFVVGIINATPDSFWKESRSATAIRAFALIDGGADILEVGGESTRPGSSYIEEEEEIIRIIPLIREIRKHSDIPISIDTRKKSVMEAAWNEGADIFNDISALEDDPECVKFIAKNKLPVVMMHKKGNPKTMQSKAKYKNCFEEVNAYLLKRTEFAIENGIKKDKIIVDPGIGFGKTPADDIMLLKRCGELCAKEFPILMGLSRKSFLGEICKRDVDERLASSISAGLLAVQNGASFLRVHDVKETIDSLQILKALK